MDITTDGPHLSLSGDLDVRSTFEVRNAIYDALARGDAHTPVTIDITDVDSIDLTALKVIAAATRNAAREGRRVVLRGACPAVLRMLHISHLIRVVEVEREPIAV